MTLDELIEALAEYPRGQVVARGFAKPHSYRGYYERLAFEPASNVTVGSMLDACHEARGNTYVGWKGGSYAMHGGSLVHIAMEGTSDGDDDGLSVFEVHRMLTAPPSMPDVETLAREVLIALYRSGAVSSISSEVEDSVRSALKAAMSA